ncbi:MAG: RsmB/NOP family class I SAM-dependent RNA methyltransferase [Eubacteriales bacterium]|nr:RsmB/NOP family class I SAM-dependent RNA methyltransferase [Eubacteriales bacterium]
MLNLPQEFLDKMEKLLGEEYEEFLASYEQPRWHGLRVNTKKITAQEFEELVPFQLKKIPWVENGYYYEEQDAPARHPFYYAGLYYLQEPSAMTPASILPVYPGERVLDLCAAPGGKATELGAKLLGEGVLVANDISASRAKALLKNIEVSGIPNAFVTNETPAKLAEQFTEFFDKILVDAPCSGEGMFRKDPAVARAWDAQKPFACAKQQKEIISRAAQMLAPGGKLLYSTCTFSPEENEEVIAYLLEQRDDMELLDIPQYEGFAPGTGLTKCVRIFPHKMPGEGHFLALLGKKSNDLSGGETGSAADGKQKRAALRKKVQTLPTAKKQAKTEQDILNSFLKDVSMSAKNFRLEIRKGQAYYVPEAIGERKGLTFLRNGLYLGEVKKDRFEPSQSFAMALKKEEYTAVVDMDYHDERVIKYLKGETIDVDNIIGTREKGWQLVCVNGYPLGWGKVSSGTLKNKYHSGWRMKC